MNWNALKPVHRTALLTTALALSCVSGELIIRPVAALITVAMVQIRTSFFQHELSGKTLLSKGGGSEFYFENDGTAGWRDLDLITAYEWKLIDGNLCVGRTIFAPSKPAFPTVSWRPSTEMFKPPNERPKAIAPSETLKPLSTSLPATFWKIHPLETARSLEDLIAYNGALPGDQEVVAAINDLERPSAPPAQPHSPDDQGRSRIPVV